MADPIVHSRRGVDGLLALISGFLLALLIWTGADLLSGDNADEIEREASPTERAEPVESESSRTDPPPSGLGSPAISARGDLRSVFSGDDYPAEAQMAGDEGTVQAQLTVGPDGRVAACRIVSSSGVDSLDRKTCDVLRQRARFTPARDRDGNPITDTVTTPPVRWQLME